VAWHVPVMAIELVDHRDDDLSVLTLLLLLRAEYKAHFYPHMPIGKVWIYRLLFFCLFVFFCVYTVMDFSAEVKASGVKFCTVVHRHLGQGISQFGELCSPRSPKSDESVASPTLGSHGAGVRTDHTYDGHVWIYGRPRRWMYLHHCRQLCCVLYLSAAALELGHPVMHLGHVLGPGQTYCPCM